MTKVGAEFQQVLRQYAEESGLTVSGSRLSVDSAGDDQEGVNSLFDVMTVELSRSAFLRPLKLFCSL